MIEPNFTRNLNSWLHAHFDVPQLDAIEYIGIRITETYPDRVLAIDTRGMLLDYAIGHDWSLGSADNHNIAFNGPYVFSLREPQAPGMQICVGRISDINHASERNTFLNIDFDIHPFTGFKQRILHTGEIIQNGISGTTTNQSVIEAGLISRGIPIKDLSV